MLEVQAKQEEEHDAEGVGRASYHSHSRHVLILRDEGQRDEECEEVEEHEDLGGAQSRPMPPILEQRQNNRVRRCARLPSQILAILTNQEVLQERGGPRTIEETEQDCIKDGRCDDTREVKHSHVVGLVKLVLAKDAMKDAISVVRVHDAFQEVLDG